MVAATKLHPGATVQVPRQIGLWRTVPRAFWWARPCGEGYRNDIGLPRMHRLVACSSSRSLGRWRAFHRTEIAGFARTRTKIEFFLAPTGFPWICARTVKLLHPGGWQGPWAWCLPACGRSRSNVRIGRSSSRRLRQWNDGNRGGQCAKRGIGWVVQWLLLISEERNSNWKVKECTNGFSDHLA